MIMLVLLGLSVLLLMSLLIFQIYYSYTHTDSKGWHKCHKCKKANPTMYYTDMWWGRKWECNDHAWDLKKDLEI